MTHESACRGGQIPSYHTMDDGCYAADFEGESVRLVLGRTRWHPGLIDVAPDTTPLYTFCANVLSGAERCVDVGCGTGVGTAILARSMGHVTGFDRDTSAVSFARRVAPKAEFVVAELLDTNQPRFDAAVIVDVLGQVANPYAMLRSVRKALVPSSRIVVAEPRAHSSQVLCSPVRRAFSQSGLSRSLQESGFDVEAWVQSATGFVICLASKRDDAQAQALEDGLAAIEGNRVERAKELLVHAARSRDVATRVRALLAQSAIHCAAGDADDAAQCLLEACAADPQDARPVVELARLVAISGDHDEAKRLTSGALDLDSCHPHAHALMALLVEATAPAYGLMCWTSAVSLAPDDPWIVASYSRRIAEAGGIEQAAAAMTRLNSYGDEIPAEFHLEFARVYEGAGRLADATIEARMARARQPADAEALALCSHLGSSSAAGAATATAAP